MPRHAEQSWDLSLRGPLNVSRSFSKSCFSDVHDKLYNEHRTFSQKRQDQYDPQRRERAELEQCSFIQAPASARSSNQFYYDAVKRDKKKAERLESMRMEQRQQEL